MQVFAGAVLLFCLSLSGSGFAQTTSGKLTGTVTNESGVRMPEATIKLRNEDTGATLSTLTNETGDYSFLIPPGKHYTLTADLEGFKQSIVTNIPVSTANALRIDLGLKGTVTVCTCRDCGVGGFWSTGTAADKNPDHVITIMLYTLFGDKAERVMASVREVSMQPGLETANVIEAESQRVKLTPTSFEFTASGKVNNATVETVYNGQLVDSDTIKVLRTTTKGKPVDLKSDGTAEPLVLRRIFLSGEEPLGRPVC